MADFNEDGKIDLAGPSNGNTVALVLGKGDGTFITFTTVSSETQDNDFSAAAFTTGDLRNDGKNDFVLFGQGGGFQLGEVVSVLGNGNGTFQPAVLSGAGSQTYGGTLGDFNNDGIPDVVTLNYNQEIGVGPGKGDGTFGNEGFYTTASQAFAVVVGDFNGDGNQDIVVPGQMFLGNGDGTFGFPVTINAGSVPMVVGDVNSDGKADIVQPGVGNAIAACLNNGNLTFTCIDTSLAGTPGLIALADFNHDRKLDVVVDIGGAVQVLLGNGDGTFQSTGTFAIRSGANSIAVADINGDGFLDLAFGGAGVSVLLGNGDGTFQAATLTYDGFGPLVAADFNGDGKIDIATLYGIDLLFNTVGLVPNAVVSPSSLTFASEPVDSTSPAQKITLQNTGGAALSISQIAISGADAGDFAQTNNCGSSLPANASCTISVTFRPTLPGARTATLAITDAVGNQMVSLTGTGTSLGLGIASGGSDSATVAAGATATYSLAIGGGGVSGSATLSCTGAPTGATCTLPSSISINASSASPFTVSVSTTAHSSAAIQHSDQSLGWYWAMGLIGIVWLPIAGRTRHVARRVGLVSSLLLMALLISCGGGGGGSASSGTPAGTYTLTVTASMGSTVQSQTLKLTAQ